MEFDSDSGEDLGKIWDTVDELLSKRTLPGLIGICSDFMVSVEVPEHPHNHPHICMPKLWKNILQAIWEA